MQRKTIKMIVLFAAVVMVLCAGLLFMLQIRNMYHTILTNEKQLKAELSDQLYPMKYAVDAMEAQNKRILLDSNQKVALDYSWVQDDLLIAHALGGVTLDDVKVDYTNSLEAFQENYEKGIRVFETDFLLSTDGGLISLHDWGQFGTEGTFSMVEFQQASFCNGKITQMSGTDIIDLMIQYPDIYIVTDTKYTEVDKYRLQFAQLVYLAQQKGVPEVLDRFIVQIYNQGMYDILCDIYPWRSFIYTLYQSPDRWDDITQFCAERGIKVVTLSYLDVDEWVVDKFKEAGADTFVHTVNDVEIMKQKRDIGVRGFYTDFIGPQDIS